MPSFGSRISGQSAARVWVTMEAAAESVVSRPSQLRIRSAALRMLVAVAVGAGRVVDGVGKAMAHLLIHLAVDVGLDGQHVGGRELVAAVEDL